MTTPIKCSDCAWFQPADTPSAQAGRCMHESRHGYYHHEALHWCRDHESTGEDDADET